MNMMANSMMKLMSMLKLFDERGYLLRRFVCMALKNFSIRGFRCGSASKISSIRGCRSIFRVSWISPMFEISGLSSLLFKILSAIMASRWESRT